MPRGGWAEEVNSEEPPDLRNADIEALRKEIELLRKDMEQQKTELDGRINVLEERTNNVRTMVYAVLIALLVSVVGTVAATLILRATGL